MRPREHGSRVGRTNETTDPDLDNAPQG